jgi:hypothetical protein
VTGRSYGNDKYGLWKGWHYERQGKERVMEGILPYSNSFINQLIEKLEECSGDGIGCEHCPVAAECTACWDTICQQLGLDEYRYSDFAARLAQLRNRKWMLKRHTGASQWRASGQ